MDHDSIIRDTDDSERVTVGEMKAAITRVLAQEFGSDGIDPVTAGVIARDVLVDLIQHREPKWRVDDIVIDATEAVWQLATATQWRQMGRPGIFPHSQPKRPLRLLDSPAARREMARCAAGLERARDDGAPV